MTLLIACILIYHFDLPPWLYAVAAIVRAGELFTAFMNWKEVSEGVLKIAARR